MNILTEIIEVSDEIIDTLKEENFFEETPFINELALKRELQKNLSNSRIAWNIALINGNSEPTVFTFDLYLVIRAQFPMF